MMTCEAVETETAEGGDAGGGRGRRRGRRVCHYCGAPATDSCDWKISAVLTCNRALCAEHAMPGDKMGESWCEDCARETWAPLRF